MLLEQISLRASLAIVVSIRLVVSGTMIAERYDRYGRRVEIHHDCNRDVVESGCDFFFCGLCNDTVLRIGIDRVIH